MKEIQIDTGIVEYKINKKCSVYFNPTDSNFAERLFDTFDNLDKQQSARENEAPANDREAFVRNRERDLEMRLSIDGLLGDGVSDKLFGGMNVYAMSDGLPVWANLMLAIIDEMDNSVKSELRKTNKRVEKYTARYRK